jgi:uncharacterized membrane protein YphA (DoxX/SURF4 family)
VPGAYVVVRILVGIAFVLTGTLKLAHHGEATALFAHWHVPASSNAVTVVAAVEFVCGVMLTFGLLTAPVALLLATDMVGATMTAGRIDGGIHIILPPILFVLCVFIAWRSTRLRPAVPGRRPGVQ